MKTPEVSQMLVTCESVSCAKCSSEAYIVTSGPTNPLDPLMMLSIVIAMTFPELNRSDHHSIHKVEKLRFCGGLSVIAAISSVASGY